MFCEKCKSLMYPDNEFMVCRKCGFKKEKKGTNIVVSKQKKKEVPFINDTGKSSILPKTKALCVKCGNKEAYWIIRQMRSSDEPESRFYTCTKCGYKWRED